MVNRTKKDQEQDIYYPEKKEVGTTEKRYLLEQRYI